MAAMDRRLDRIEAVYGSTHLDVVERLHAGRALWAKDPVAAAHEAVVRRVEFLSECQAILASGSRLTALQGRLMRAHVRLAEARS